MINLNNFINLIHFINIINFINFINIINFINFIIFIKFIDTLLLSIFIELFYFHGINLVPKMSDIDD